MPEAFKSSDSPVPQPKKTPPKPPTVQETIAALPGRIFRREALGLVIALIVGAGAYAYAQSKVDARLQAAIDGGIAPVKAKLEEHITTEKQAVEQLQLDVAQIRRDQAMKEERDAARFDLLYRTILTGRPQPRADELAAPVPVSTPDAGR